MSWNPVLNKFIEIKNEYQNNELIKYKLSDNIIQILENYAKTIDNYLASDPSGRFVCTRSAQVQLCRTSGRTCTFKDRGLAGFQVRTLHPLGHVQYDSNH